jgi:outer membrane protein TolC
MSALLCLTVFLAPRAITLPEAIELARKNNLDLRGSATAVERADADAKAVRAQLGPTLSANDALQFWNDKFAPEFMGEPFLLRDQFTNALTLSASQPLVGLLQYGSQYRSQSRLADAAHADHRATRDEVTFRAIESYLRLLEATDLAAIANQAIRDIEEQARTAKALVAAGTLIEADYLRTQVALAQARQDLLRAQAQLGSSRAQLAAIIGLPIGTELEAAPVDRNALPALPSSLEDALANLPERRPELHAARARSEAAELARTAAWSALLPQVNAAVAFQHLNGFGPFQPENAGWVGGTLTWNFWEWGAQYYSARSASARAEQGDLEFARKRRDAELEATQRFLDARAARASIDVAATAAVQAREAYRVARALYENGSATTTDLLDAQLALERARVNDARSTYDYLVAYHAFARAAGTLAQP